MFIDSHAHIYLEEFDDDLSQLVDESIDNKISSIYMPNIDSTTIDRLHATEDKYEGCKAMMGLHPVYVKDNYKVELKIIEESLKTRKYAAIGEIGIDLYWDKSTKKEQLEAFEFQINLAKEHGLAIIIHSRDSLEETISIVEKHQDGNLNGIFHCFNGTIDEGRRIVDAGFFMGVGGVVTFKNAGVDKVIAHLPLENMVLETDAPYLSPAPFRGKRNTPNHIPIIAEKISDLLEVDTSKVGRITSENCRKLFLY